MADERALSANPPSEFGADGWRIVAGSFLGIAGGFSSLFFYSVGVFLRPMATEFGWSRGEASLQTVAIAVANFIAVPIAGRLVDRFNPVRLAGISLVALSLGFFSLGFLTSSLVSFLILSTLATLFSAASTPVTYNQLIIGHFRRSRGLALGLALTAIGMGATLLPPLLGPFIADHGWRSGYMLLCCAVLPLGAAMMVLLRHQGRPLRMRQPAQPILEVILCRPIATISLLIFLIAMAVLGTVVHLVPMLLDRGMTATQAGMIASTLGLGVIVGRVATGKLLDIADAGIVTAALLSMAVAGMLLLWNGAAAALVPGAMLTGLALGMESDLIAFLVGRRFPLRSFGTAYGCVFACHVVGGGVGPTLAGYLFDLTGDYRAWLLCAATALAMAAIVAALTERGVVCEPQDD